MKVDLKVGDVILTGKWKNKKVTVKEFGTNELGQPTVNGKPMLNFRIARLMPEKEDLKELWVPNLEYLIKQYGLTGPGPLLKFKDDPHEYVLKNVSPDRKSVFVTLNHQQTYRKPLNKLEKVNRKYVGWFSIPLIYESSTYLKEMGEEDKYVPRPDEKALELMRQRQAATQGGPIEQKFMMELASKLRFAFSDFLDTMNQYGISKTNPQFEAEFKVKYPASMDMQLKGLYYKFTQGGSDLLKGMSFEQLIAIVLKEVQAHTANDFYIHLKDIVTNITKQVIGTLKKESMTEGKDLKVQLLIEQIMGEAKAKLKLAPAPIQEQTLEEYKDPYAPDSKDEMRISDILTKARGSKGMAIQLAQRMAFAITDVAKAYRRFRAAEDMNAHQIAHVFYKRYRDLGGK
jgi:hypothetical protein